MENTDIIGGIGFMKVGFFTDGYLPQINGVATSTEELARSLRNIKNKVTIIAPEYPLYKDSDKDVLRLKSFKLFKNPELRFAYMFPDKVLRRVLTKDFDVIHGFSGGSIPSLGLFLAKIKRKPYIFTYNTRYNQYTHYILNGKLVKPKVVEVTMAVFCNQCDIIIAPSDFIKDELLSFGVKKPITVIPNGIDIEKFKKMKANTLRKNLGLKKQDKLVLYMGRLAKEKAVDFIIKAFEKTSKDVLNSYLVIVGDGPEKENLEKLTEKFGLTGRVVFLGYVSFKEVPKIYSQADLFVFASTTETQGMVILEAMASKVPVLTVKDRVFENIIKNGEEGFMVDKDVKIFSEKMSALLKDDRLLNKVSKRARKKVEQFSLIEIANKFDTLYKSFV